MLLALFAFANSQEEYLWFTYIQHPLELCLQKIYGELQGSSGAASFSLEQLGACSAYQYRVQMKCSVHEDYPDINKTSICTDEKAKVLNNPCGYIATAAQAYQCLWWIIVPPVLTINITFTEFNLPFLNPECIFDHVIIKSFDEAYVRYYCGRREPFTIIPNVSKLKIIFSIPFGHNVPGEVAYFQMFYQVVDHGLYVMNGDKASENTQTDPFLTYQFHPQNQIMKLKETKIYSLHISVDIGFFITVRVLFQTLTGKNSILHAYDGPSTICHILKHFQVSDQYQVASSFGTSLLLLLETASLEESHISITYSSTRHNLFKPRSIRASIVQKSLVVPLQEAEHCSSHHFITFCELLIESNLLGNFVKLEDIVINMKIPDTMDCHFGSVWIFDVKSSKPVWKWCAFKRPFLQQLTSTSHQLSIKAVVYDTNNQGFDVKMQYRLSSCQGHFVYNEDLMNISNYNYRIKEFAGRLYYDTVSFSGCNVLQALPVSDTDELYALFTFANTEYSNLVSKYTFVRQSVYNMHFCSNMWRIFSEGLTWPYVYGRGEVLLGMFDWYQTHITVQATSLGIEMNVPVELCTSNYEVIVIADDACDQLFTDRTFLSFYPYLSGMEFTERFSSSCTQYLISLQYPNIFRLSFSGHPLCAPQHREQQFPCLSKEGTLCESISSCSLRIEVQKVGNDPVCEATGFHVDVMNVKETVRLRWHLRRQEKVAFIVDMFPGDIHAVMDIARDDVSDENCSLQITQTLIKNDILMGINTKILKLGSPTSCLKQVGYSHHIGDKRRAHCFKWSVSEDHVLVDDMMYIRVNSSDLTWIEAEQFCESHGGHLVSITSTHEENIVKTLFDGGSSLLPSAVYIGIQVSTNNVSY